MVTADSSGSTDGDATPIATYQFDFGDGTVVGAAGGSTATHTYATVGSYTITLTVVDTAGLSSTASATVTVS
jgi:PKD repeat protein